MAPALLPDCTALAAERLADPVQQLRVTATDFGTGAWFVLPSGDWLPAKVRVAFALLRSEPGRP